jgi:alkaline phosphatase
MKRRKFITNLYASGSLILLSNLSISCKDKPKGFRFGLISDLHYADRTNLGNRFCSHSINKLKDAVDQFKKSSLDFIIELGDFKDQGEKPQRVETLQFLDTIEKVYQSSGLPAYHVMGNHDMDSISKNDFLSHTSNPGNANKKSYYSFIVNGIKCIVLDANYNQDGSDYDAGNFDWKYAMIPEKEQIWLKKELNTGDEPVLVFLHQLLNENAHPLLQIHNAKDIRLILEQSERVLAVFQGHHHAGDYEKINNIHYFTMKGAIEGEYPKNNSYAVVEVTPNGDIFIEGYINCSDKILKMNPKL